MSRKFSVVAVLAASLMIGCGGTFSPTTTVQTSAHKSNANTEIAIPPDVAVLFEKGEYALAVQTLSTLIEREPHNENLYSLRATSYLRQGLHDLALADLDQAISLKSQDAKLYNNRGFVRLGLQSFKAALSDFDQATELAPQFMNAYNNRGLLYIAQSRFDDAIQEFNRAIELDPQYADAYNNRGFAALEAGQMEQALDDFNLTLRLDPEYVNAYNNRGLLRARAGDYKNAIIDFTEAMMRDPLNPKYYEHRCEVYLRQGATDKAVADEKKIVWLIQLHEFGAEIARQSQPADVLISRAEHYLHVDDLDKALVDLDRSIVLDPRSARAFAARADVHLRQQRILEAKADAEASLAIEPAQQAYSVLGDVYLKQLDFDRAIENFAYARRVDPLVAEAYYLKSRSLAQQGQGDQSQSTLEQAIALDPDVERRLR